MSTGLMHFRNLFLLPENHDLFIKSKNSFLVFFEKNRYNNKYLGVFKLSDVSTVNVLFLTCKYFLFGGVCMGKWLDLDSPLVVFLTRITDLFLLNIAFLLFSLPIFTIGAASTALYRVMLNIQKGEDAKPLAQFVSAFRANFRKASLLFLILFLPLVLVVYYAILLTSGSFSSEISLLIPSITVIVIFSCIWSMVWPLQAQFENTPFSVIKNALRLSLAYLPRTILMAGINGLPFWLFLMVPDFFVRIAIFWLVIGFSLSTRINAFLARKILTPLFERAEVQEPDQIWRSVFFSVRSYLKTTRMRHLILVVAFPYRFASAGTDL